MDCEPGVWRLGPRPQRPRNLTKSCEGVTLDVKTLNGLLKGAHLPTKHRDVFGFFSVPYARDTGRWSHAEPLQADEGEEGEASDHCSSKWLQQLRTDSPQRGSFCFQWLPGLGRFGSENCLTLDVCAEFNDINDICIYTYMFVYIYVYIDCEIGTPQPR